MDYVATITGHRPKRIPSMQLVSAQLRNAFIDLGVTHVIQGMAAGVDLAAARVAHQLHIPYSCAIPWEGHHANKGDENKYLSVLTYCDHVWYVNDSQGYPGPQVYQERNEFMVDRSHCVIAVWDGVKSGGTWNCIKYAMDENRPIYRINPIDGESGWYDKALQTLPK